MIMIFFIEKQFIEVPLQAYIPHGACELEAIEFYKEKGYSLQRMKGKGVPDFFVENGKMSFWVEVKREGNWLNKNQLEWIKCNPNELVVVHNVAYSQKKMGGQ